MGRLNLKKNPVKEVKNPYVCIPNPMCICEIAWTKLMGPVGVIQ